MGRRMLSSLKGMAHMAADPAERARELTGVPPPDPALTADSGSERSCVGGGGRRCEAAGLGVCMCQRRHVCEAGRITIYPAPSAKPPLPATPCPPHLRAGVGQQRVLVPAGGQLAGGGRGAALLLRAVARAG